LGEVVFSAIDAVTNNSISNFKVKVFNTVNNDQLETLDTPGESVSLLLPFGSYQVEITKAGYESHSRASCAVIRSLENECSIFIQKSVNQNFGGEFNLTSRNSTGEIGNRSSYNPSLSNNGRYVAFGTRSQNFKDNDDTDKDRNDIYVFDTQERHLERISKTFSNGFPDENSYNPTISDDGRFVLFTSFANNLVENDNNDARDVFVYDR